MSKSATLDEIEIPEDRFAAAEKALEKGSKKKLPNISPAPEKDESLERRNSSVSLPEYVWDLLREEGFKNREPQNIVIMRGLKKLGLPIRDEDLIDPRKLRYQG